MRESLLERFCVFCLLAGLACSMGGCGSAGDGPAAVSRKEKAAKGLTEYMKKQSAAQKQAMKKGQPPRPPGRR
jgi:hypothetical protein